ncbi:MAG: ATP-binding protein [Bacteroidota bacterium]
MKWRVVVFLSGLLMSYLFAFSQVNEQSAQQKVERLRNSGQLHEASRQLSKIASDYWKQGAYPKAITHYQQALEHFRELQNINGIADTYSHLGMIYSDMGEYEQAVVYLNKNLQTRIEEGKRKKILRSLINLSVVLNNLERYEESILHLKQAKIIAQDLNDSEKMRSCYGMLAETYEKIGDLEQTRVHFDLYRSFHEMIQRKKEAKNQQKLAEAKAQAEILEFQKKNQRLELELRNRELQIRQQQLAQKQAELQDIESLLVQFDSANRALILHADKKDLVILTLQEQKRSRKLALEKAKMGQQAMMGVLIFFGIFGIVLLRNYRQKTRMTDKLKRKNQEILYGKHQLEESNQQLEEAAKRAQAASHAKSQFLSTISHEIRTPMNSVIGFTNLLRMDNPLPHQDQYLKTLEFSANHLLALINDVLDFSKIEAGKLELDLSPMDIEELMTHLRQTFLPKAEESGIHLYVQANRPIKQLVMGDMVRLNQILTNLVGNAIKFTAEGEVSIRYQLIEEKEDKLLCRISVSDTGIGISPEKCEAIFEQFTQANSDTTRKFGGTGLGLAISKHLTELMGGRIWVESEEGKGSNFHIEIPFHSCQPVQTTPLSEDVQQTTDIQDFEGMSILVADDNPINIVIVEQFLQRWKVEVETVEDGEEAVRQLLAHPGRFDLVLMDLQMPVMDGYEATLTIRAQADPYFQQLGIIALTASASTEVQDKVKASKLNGHLSKPFNPQDLFDTLKPYYLASGKYVSQEIQIQADRTSTS